MSADQNEQQRDERHRTRMQRKKAVVDAKVAEAQVERGVLLVNTGNGKGKSSAAFGLLARTLGHGLQGAVVQFIKSGGSTGEEAFFRRFPEQVQFHVLGEGFTWETQDRQRDIDKAMQAWAVARELLRDASIALIVLDELNIALKYGYIPLQTVLEDLAARPPMQHVVITGRGAPAGLIEVADTVSDITLIKHAFQAGVKAQPCLEF